MSAIVIFTGNNRELLGESLDLMAHRGEEKTIYETVDGYQMASVAGRAFSASKLRHSSSEGIAVIDGFLLSPSGSGWSEETVQLYRELGKRFLERLEGSFSLAVNDGKETIVARDPIGLKPLYYGLIGRETIFASELKAIAPYCDEVALFPPGHYFTREEGFKEYSTCREIIDSGEIATDKEKAIEDVRETLEDSIRKRLEVLNCEPSIFLSGGLDSSCIAASLKPFVGSFKTFTVGKSDGEDPGCARVVADHLGTEHLEYFYDLDEMLEVLPDVIYHLESFDPLLVRSSIPNFILSKLASENGCEFVFMGEGADELFAGYDYMKKIGAGEEIEAELLHITENGHRSGFQRDDRMALAHGIEYDVPFMDQEMLKLAFSIPIEWKLHGKDKTEKWILRKAFEDQLPHEIVWRRKKKFSIGAGSYNLMEKYAQETVSQEQFERDREKAGIRTKEESLYFNIFKEVYHCEGAIETVYRN
ncbi:Asparagine synthetase [Mesotoga infera]|uniref:Asparagine synthetase n=1 Tax=Mesotoga infera TaxID=1236046 RepID=A0A7Z7PR38_9BACT|nr:asparagine synthase-related protein [Mesotoga infera]SSC12393.1 Asparagine synthetase [Mesotoga infera]